MLIGYSRISIPDEKLDIQNDALKNAGCEKIFSDVSSDSKTKRDELNKALESLKKDDILVIEKLDRLGRSLRHLIKVVIKLSKKGIGFRSLQEDIDTTTATGKQFVQIFRALAEFEKDIIRERTKAGLNSARARGRKGGRPKKMNKEKIEMAQSMYDKKTIPIKDICEKLKISKVTLYRYIKKDTK